MYLITIVILDLHLKESCCVCLLLSISYLQQTYLIFHFLFHFFFFSPANVTFPSLVFSQVRFAKIQPITIYFSCTLFQYHHVLISSLLFLISREWNNKSTVTDFHWTCILDRIFKTTSSLFCSFLGLLSLN